jgi:hypothetical protein
VDARKGRVVGEDVPRAVVVSALIGVVALVLDGAERVEKSALSSAGDFVRIGSGASIVVGVNRCSIRLEAGVRNITLDEVTGRTWRYRIAVSARQRQSPRRICTP